MVTRPWVLIGAVTLMLASGCSSAATSAAPSGAPSAAPSSPPAPSPSSPAPEPEPSESSPPACGPVVEDAVTQTVADQLAAFSAGDFRDAFSYASDSFRGATSLKGFRAIITEGYPEVADSVAHEVVDCLAFGPSAAAAIVSVTGRNDVTVELAYRFVQEAGEWRIDGASTVRRAEAQTV